MNGGYFELLHFQYHTLPLGCDTLTYSNAFADSSTVNKLL